MRWVLSAIEDLTGCQARIEYAPRRAGDQQHTMADISRARTKLGFNPQTSLREGLAAQVAWQRAQLFAEEPDSDSRAMALTVARG